MGTITNSCACVAAAVCVGYYDYTLTNLIPDFDPYFTIGGKLRPKGTGLTGVKDKVQGVINTMYNLMGTNSIEPGTNDVQFFNGFSQYVIGKGSILSEYVKKLSKKYIYKANAVDLLKEILLIWKPYCSYPMQNKVIRAQTV